MTRYRILAAVGMLFYANHLTAVEPTTPDKPAPPEKTGIAVGAKAPAIALQDQAGKKQTLSTLQGEARYLAIVFYRSASW